MTKKCLVLGSSGFIGGHLVKQLIDDGCYVVGVDIRKIRHSIFTPDEFKLADLRDINVLQTLLKTYYDEVFQLACDMGGATYINCGDSDGSVMRNSVTINSNLLKCASETKIGKIFFSSSACVYPKNNNNIAHCDEENVYPAFPDNEYGWEKLFSERMYKNYEKQFGLDIYIARFHSIVGDYSVYNSNRSKAHAELAYKVATVENNGTIELIGDGEQIRTFLYVKDCIKAIRMLLDNNCKEILNIGCDQCITLNQYVNILKLHSGKQFKIKYIAGPTGVKYRYCNIEKIQKLINWRPETSVEESAKITYDYICSQLNRPVVGFISQKIGCKKEEAGFCGIGLRGKLIIDLLEDFPSTKYNFIPAFLDNEIEVEEFIQKYNPKVIIYNYHFITTPWLDSVDLNKYPIKHIMIHYDVLQKDVDNFAESSSKFGNFKYVITDNNKIIPNSNVFVVTRTIPYSNRIEHATDYDNQVPKIGFQGFGFLHKGIIRIADKIQEEFDAAIFRLHMPYSYFGDPNGIEANKRINEIQSVIKNPNIKLEVSHDFLSDDEIIRWLSENTINCYFYDWLEESGIASSPDYAIASRRPFAINNSRMFIHLHNLEPSIEIEHNSLKEIIANGIAPLLPIYKLYNQKNVVRDFEVVCDKVISS